MGTFVEYDPVFGDLLSSWSTSAPEAERERLDASGASWLEYEGALPGNFHQFAVNRDRQLVVRQPLPASCLLADREMGLGARMPEVPGLPSGGVTIPEAGSPLPSGLTTIVVRAPYCLDHHFTIYVETPEDRKRTLVATAAERRDAMADGGVMFRGHVIASDDRCANRVLRSIEAARRDPSWSTIWECADGAALPLTGADLGALHDAIETHRATAFARSSATKVDIEAGAITTPDDVVAAMAGR